ncbi:MAG: aminopeptidase [Bacteroidales bacterium]|jgi:bleomycin hydrolase|nr:aminopeptidase [Bacteroidales bacterium]
MKNLILGLSLLFLISPAILNAQADKKEEGFNFKVVKQVKSTPVKNQYRSGTCWSFSGLGFFENELLRMGKEEIDLSEMFVVRNSYYDKGIKYVRFHGSLNFGGGGSFQDVVDVIANYGIVPEKAYQGLNYGTKGHVHGELDALLKGYVDAVLKNRNRKLTPAWKEGMNGIIDAYLGDYPKTFTYNGREYTPASFRDELGINPEDYVMISSYTHHPFYEPFVIEVPDNWSYGVVYNLPLNEMMEVIDNAIQKDYSVAWAADVSEKGFKYNKGVALVPEKKIEDLSDSEKSKWEELSASEKAKQLYSLTGPTNEKKITQEIRQEAFDNYTTTDDHGMVIEGVALDQKGNHYYIVKNSWGTTNAYKGYFYASKAFVEFKTMSILVNKNSIPKSIRKKLKL